MPESEPLYTAEEMRTAEAGHDTRELMERAGALAAEAALQEMHGAQRWTVVCGAGANGGDGRIMARHLEAKGKQVRVVDAIFGTGFAGTPRPDAATLIERINAHTAKVLSVDVPSGVDASTGEVPGA